MKYEVKTELLYKIIKKQDNALTKMCFCKSKTCKRCAFTEDFIQRCDNEIIRDKLFSELAALNAQLAEQQNTPVKADKELKCKTCIYLNTKNMCWAIKGVADVDNENCDYQKQSQAFSTIDRKDFFEPKLKKIDREILREELIIFFTYFHASYEGAEEIVNNYLKSK